MDRRKLKLVSTITGILISILIVYFFFIVMKPNTNETVVPMHLKNGAHHKQSVDNTVMNGIDMSDESHHDSDLIDDYVDGIEHSLLENIVPLSYESTDHYLPANELNFRNYKDLENANSEKEIYTNDTPLFNTTESKNKQINPLDLNSEHRRVNFY